MVGSWEGGRVQPKSGGDGTIGGGVGTARELGLVGKLGRDQILIKPNFNHSRSH